MKTPFSRPFRAGVSEIDSSVSDCVVGRARRQRPIRIAVFTNLYPNSQQPRHGAFVEQRLRPLVASVEAQAQVVAPVPWFWSRHPRYGRYAQMAAVPDQKPGMV